MRRLTGCKSSRLSAHGTVRGVPGGNGVTRCRSPEAQPDSATTMRAQRMLTRASIPRRDEASSPLHVARPAVAYPLCMFARVAALLLVGVQAVHAAPLRLQDVLDRVE